MAPIVNKKDGYLGVHYGWDHGSLAHYPKYDRGESPLTYQQHAPKGKAKATPGPGRKNQPRQSTPDDERPEIPPSPPPRVQSTSHQAVTKGKGRATPRLGLQHQPASPPPPHQSTSQQAAPKGKGSTVPRVLARKVQLESPPSPPPRVQSTSQQAVTKGKGRATPRLGLQHQPASPPPPHQSTSQQASPKGKGGVAHGSRKKRRSRESDTSEEALRSRRKRQKANCLVVEEMDVDHSPEPPHSDTGDSVAEVVPQTDEERDEEETVKSAPDHPPNRVYWDGFLKEMECMKGKAHASSADWLADLRREAKKYLGEDLSTEDLSTEDLST